MSGEGNRLVIAKGAAITNCEIRLSGKNNKIYIKNSNRIDKNINCFYVVYGERKDVDKLEVEMEAK